MSALAVAPPEQLSFDVGQNRNIRPAGASIAITGKASTRTQLRIDDEVIVQIVNGDGEIIASFDGTCADIGFKKHDATETASAWIERVQKIKLAGGED